MSEDPLKIAAARNIFNKKKQGIDENRKVKRATLKGQSSQVEDPFEPGLDDVEETKLDRDEIDELYAKAKDIKEEKQDNPDYDIDGLKRDNNDSIPLGPSPLETKKKDAIPLGPSPLETKKKDAIPLGPSPLEIKMHEEEEHTLDTVKKGERLANLEVIEGEVVDDEERGERMKDLENKLKDARRDFAEMDFKKKNMWKKVSNFFNVSERKKKKEKIAEDSKGLLPSEMKIQKGREYDEEVAYMEAFYENALHDFKTAWLEDIKNKGLKGENIEAELKGLINYFNVGEIIELNRVRDEERVKTTEGSKMEWAKSKMLALATSYNKMPLKYKLIISGVLLGGSIAALPFGAAIGSATLGLKIAAILGALKGAKGIISGVGTGALVGMHAEKAMSRSSEKKENKKSEKEARGFIEKTEMIDLEERLAQCKSLIDSKIYDVDKKLQDKKLSSLMHKSGAVVLGAGVGYLVGSGEAFKLARSGWERVSDFWSHGADMSGGGMKPYDIDSKKAAEWLNKDMNATEKYVNDLHSPIAPETHSILENQPVPEAEVEQPMGTNVPEEDLRELKVGTGKTGSLWGTLNEHFKGAGLSEEEAAKKASSMAHKYIEENGFKNGNLIHEGAEIKLDPTGERIIGIDDPHHFGDMPEHQPSGITSPENPSGVEGQEPNIKMESAEGDPRIEIEGESDAVKEFSEIDQSTGNKIVEEIQNKADEINRIEDQPMSRYSDGDPSKYYGDIERLKGSQRELWDKLMQENTVSEVAGDIRKEIAISNPENWRQIKNLTFDQLKDAEVGDDVKNNIAKIYRLNVSVFGKESMPKNGETVARWTERLARLFINMKK